jgi:hypothetical protein
VWPATPEVALAYMDQLLRSDSIHQKEATRLTKLLNKVAVESSNWTNNDLARKISETKIKVKNQQVDERTQHRLIKLHETLKGIVQDLET